MQLYIIPIKQTDNVIVANKYSAGNQLLKIVHLSDSHRLSCANYQTAIAGKQYIITVVRLIYFIVVFCAHTIVLYLFYIK